MCGHDRFSAGAVGPVISPVEGRSARGTECLRAGLISPAIDSMATHSDGFQSLPSRTVRTVHSITSAEDFRGPPDDGPALDRRALVRTNCLRDRAPSTLGRIRQWRTARGPIATPTDPGAQPMPRSDTPAGETPRSPSRMTVRL